MKESDRKQFKIAVADTDPLNRLVLIQPDGDLWASPPGALNEDGIDAAALLNISARWGRAQQIWIHPDLSLRLQLPIPAHYLDGAAPSTFLMPRDGFSFNTDGLTPWVRAASPGRESVGLAFPTVAPGGQLYDWAKAPDGQVLWKALQAFQNALGWGWRSSAGWTSTTLLQSLYGRFGGPGESDPPTVPDGELPLVWTRALAAAEQYAGYVHVFDANSQYLPAAAAIELGTGKPEHRTSDVRFDPRIAGWWRALISKPRSRLLPDPLHSGGKMGARWVTSPTLQYALELGCDFTVSEAWVWPESHRWLRRWAEQISAARRVLVYSGELHDRIALGALKSIYKVGLGWLATDRRRGDELHRPDWEAAVRAKARCNLVRRLYRLAQTPFAIDVDALWFAAKDPDPVTFAAWLGLPYGLGLGQFKAVRSFPIIQLSDVPLGEPTAPRILRQLTMGA